MLAKRIILLMLLTVPTACARDDNEPTPPSSDDKLRADVATLRVEYDRTLDEAAGLRDPESGWLVAEDCDGALWSGKYAAVTRAEPMKWDAAEYEPGRYARRPLAQPCVPTNPNSSSWSRDMGKGLLAYAWRTRDLAILEQHVAYGIDHDWLMGEPLGDGRAVYTPSMIGQLYETIFALGGEDNANRLWPDVYPGGRVDYEAHLQVMNIWHRGEVAELLHDGDARAKQPGEPVIVDEGETTAAPVATEFALLDVSDQMLQRLSEHAAREPQNPFFAAELAVYTGDYRNVVTLLLHPDKPVGSYVRCEALRKCQLAEWLFSADIVLRRLQAL